jgi:hypothetical protein
MSHTSSYHFRRAQDELRKSHAACDAGAAACHRALSVLHLGQLMSSPNEQERAEASAMLAIIEGSSPPERRQTAKARSIFWSRPIDMPCETVGPRVEKSR